LTLRKIILYLFLFLIAIAESEAQDLPADSGSQDYYSADNIRRFADYLKVQGDFLRAASEYDRLQFLLRLTAGSDSALFNSGICYLRGGHTQRAYDRLRQFQESYIRSPLLPASKYYLARATYDMNNWDEVIEMLGHDAVCRDTTSIALGARNILCLSYARLGQWSLAETTACGTIHSTDSARGRDELCRTVLQGENLKYKSKWKAAILSTLVPGLGKFYAGRKADGLFAFVTIGSSAWQSFRGFHEDGSHSVRGWVFGVFAAAFHIGNIYGATVSVEINNNKIRHDYFHEWEMKLVFYGS